MNEVEKLEEQKSEWETNKQKYQHKISKIA